MIFVPVHVVQSVNFSITADNLDTLSLQEKKNEGGHLPWKVRLLKVNYFYSLRFFSLWSLRVVSHLTDFKLS